jgi:hypothetical protein
MDREVCPLILGTQRYTSNTLLSSMSDNQPCSLPRIRSRKYVNCLPCRGFVKKSPIISFVGQYLISMLPCSIWSVMKKIWCWWLVFVCLMTFSRWTPIRLHFCCLDGWRCEQFYILVPPEIVGPKDECCCVVDTNKFGFGTEFRFKILFSGHCNRRPSAIGHGVTHVASKLLVDSKRSVHIPLYNM